MEADGRGVGAWLRAIRSSRGEGKAEEADGDAAEEGGNMSVAVLWRGAELDWETLKVEEPEEEEEGPTRAVLAGHSRSQREHHCPFVP
jgi:hypothetical protein